MSTSSAQDHPGVLTSGLQSQNANVLKPLHHVLSGICLLTSHPSQASTRNLTTAPESVRASSTILDLLFCVAGLQTVFSSRSHLILQHLVRSGEHAAFSVLTLLSRHHSSSATLLSFPRMRVSDQLITRCSIRTCYTDNIQGRFSPKQCLPGNCIVLGVTVQRYALSRYSKHHRIQRESRFLLVYKSQFR